VVTQLENLQSHPAVANRLLAGDRALHGWIYHIGVGGVTVYDERSGKFETPQAGEPGTGGQVS
jgi:carbonic anhydrase